MVVTSLVEGEHTTLHVDEKLLGNSHVDDLDAIPQATQDLICLLASTSTIILHDGFQPIKTLQDGLLALRLEHHLLKRMDEVLEVVCRRGKQLVDLGMDIAHASDNHTCPVAVVDLQPERSPAGETGSRLPQTIDLESCDGLSADREGVECPVPGFDQGGLVVMAQWVVLGGSAIGGWLRGYGGWLVEVDGWIWTDG